MFRFAIRDWFWLTMVIGLVTHAWIDRKSRWEADCRTLMINAIHDREMANGRARIHELEAKRYAALTRALEIELVVTREALQSARQTAAAPLAPAP